MLRITQLKIKVSHTEAELVSAICRTLSIRADELSEYRIIRRSVDARKKPVIMYSYTIDILTPKEAAILKKNRNNPNIIKADEVLYEFPCGMPDRQKQTKRPVIIGSGPAGLFCALMLAEHGYRPIVLERGECVEKRMERVREFWETGKLSPDSNVQFGEGGAGTFSDGKLNTLVKDISGRNRKVLEIFVKAGAPEDILYVNKPHIGTDILCRVVKNIRQEIGSLGGEIRFNSRVSEFIICKGRISGVRVNEKDIIEADTVVLAVGHSARDTFSELYSKGTDMEQKAFAAGVRIQHPQSMINISQYGEAYPDCLPAADYKLTYQASNNRGVYSFCMCPGGYVVNASSEQGRLAVNGMSYRDRAGKNANSAIIVTVTPEDFGSTHPLAGVEYQRRLEESAYSAAGGRIPLQLFGDFARHSQSPAAESIEPQVKGEYSFGADLWNILPEYICSALLEGIRHFGTRIKGFDRDDAILAAVESRTSSPVRIKRNEELESNIKGLYPCGEGAGYAGGITSAAMDGLKVAEAIAKKYMP